MAIGTESTVKLRRVLKLPLLVFYGLGVTVGAGIFALIGEIVRVSGDGAPTAFLLAGLIAAVTGISYGVLSGKYPRAGGEAVYVNLAMGHWLAALVGYGVICTAIVSSAVIVLSFSGYLGTLIPVSEPVLLIALLLLLSFVASIGVRESVVFAAIITVLEIGTLLIVIFVSAPVLTDVDIYQRALAPGFTVAGGSVIISGAVIAFFAFIGFEDLVNMAEETVQPDKTMPRAVAITLSVTIVLYVVIALIAIAQPDRHSLTNSSAPMATLFHSATGFSGKPVSVMASIAMVNGILVQILMASRVLFGMTRERLAPKALGILDAKRQTPVRAIVLVTALIALLSLLLPLVKLAHLTSLITLSVFLLVNLSLWIIGAKDEHLVLRKWRPWGLLGAILCGSLLLAEVVRQLHLS